MSERARRSPTALLLCALLVGCSSSHPAPPDGTTGARALAAIRESGVLTVLTRNAPTTDYLDAAGHHVGPEHDLAVAFAEHLGVKVKFVTLPSTAAVLDALAANQGDLAAAGLTATPQRARRFRFGPAYRDIAEQLICRRGGKRARRLDQLAKVRIVVTKRSSYLATLETLRKTYPNIQFESTDTGTEQLLEQVWRRQIDCTVADSNIAAINRRYYPELSVDLDLAHGNHLVWMMPGDAAALQSAADRWFASREAQRRLARIQQRYYAFIPVFDFVDMRSFRRRIFSRLPKYRALFTQAGQRTHLDPLLLAAQSYQESHWDPYATSPTGVRGIMMLTRNTAQSLGISNRLDARQSINGGARYLSRLKRRIDDDVPEPDRTWLALAAYNVGHAHLSDAQQLVRDAGGDPKRWAEVRTMLPRLSDEDVYSTLENGYARGDEAVRYVSRIRNYRDVLATVLRR